MLRLKDFFRYVPQGLKLNYWHDHLLTAKVMLAVIY